METSVNSTSDSAADLAVPQPQPVASVVPARPSPISEALINEIAALSASIFPGPVSFEITNDPENPSDEYVVFDVVAKGEYAQYRDRIIAWHDEIDRIVPDNDGAFRLIVHPQP